MNVINLQENQIKELGEKVGIYYQDKPSTTMEGRQKSQKLAAGLKSLGVGRGDHVVISLMNSPEVLTCFSAIWRIGAVVVPIMFLLGEDETRYILDHSDAKVVITSADLLTKINNARKGIGHIEKIIVLGGQDDEDQVGFESLLERSPVDESIEHMDGEDLAMMMYTSGTTGRPKGVTLTHNNLQNAAESSYKSRGFDKAVIALFCLPLAHIFGATTFITGFIDRFRESHWVIMRRFDPEEMFRLIDKYKVNLFFGVPTMYQILLNHPKADQYDLSSLERCNIGAAPVTPELYRAFTEKFQCGMYEVYGMTEHPGGVAMCRPGMKIKTGSCGISAPGVTVKIFDRSDKELPPHEPGEIVVRGPNVMKGYYKDPKATAEILRGGWLHTGDVGYLDEEGYLYITDRIKDMIIKGGENIYPVEIEKVLVENPKILEAAVIGIPDQKYGEEVMALIIKRPNEELTEEEVIQFTKTKITPFKCPAKVKFMNALPKTLTGKVLKKELRKMV